MTDVYLAVLPKCEPKAQISCAERQKEIDGISNEKTRREKYYVWRLLEYAIKNSLGADASRLCFTKGKNRKWSCEGFEFSLSHSGDALAVAISDRAVGVDVECVKVRNAERMAEYMLTQSEHGEYDILFDTEREEWLIRKWCQKEAIFKSWDKDIFAPSKIEVTEFSTCVKAFEIESKKYILAVALSCDDNIKVFENTEIF